MALEIDPLSVATQGFLESPGLPNIEGKRDALRIATLGWIILDFGGLPDPDQESDAVFVQPCNVALVADTSTAFNITAFSSAAQIVDSEVAMVLTPYASTFLVDDNETVAKVRPGCVSAILEAPATEVTLKSGQTAVAVDLPPAEAEIVSGRTQSVIEHTEDDS